MALPFLALAAAGLLADPAGNGYVAGVEQWRARYEEALKADDGWLTLAGLSWLKDGDNTVGAGDSNDIPLPMGSPAKLGVFHFHEGRTEFIAAPGVDVTVDGKSAPSAVLKDDSEGAPSLIRSGSLTLMVIHRGKRYGVRVKDTRGAARTDFTGLHWYPVREEYRVTADFHAYAKPKLIPIPNILGDTENTPSPGYAEFTLHGSKLRLEPVEEGDELFFIFHDATSGKTTYGAGRFLKAAAAVNGKVVLDFNKAYNPPCAFTPYATCPLPPASNRLAAVIDAGELKYGNH